MELLTDQRTEHWLMDLMMEQQLKEQPKELLMDQRMEYWLMDLMMEQH